MFFSMRISNTSNLMILQSSLEKQGWCYSLDGKKIDSAQDWLQKIGYLARYLFGNIKEERLQRAIVNSFISEDKQIIEEFLKEKTALEASPKQGNQTNRVRFFPILIEKYSHIHKQFSEEGIVINEASLSSLIKVHHVFQDILCIEEQIQHFTPQQIDRLLIADEKKIILNERIEKKPTPDGQEFVAWLKQARQKRKGRELQRKCEFREWRERRKFPQIPVFQDVLDQMRQNLEKVDAHILNLPHTKEHLKQEIISAALDEIFRLEEYLSEKGPQQAQEKALKILLAVNEEELEGEELDEVLNDDAWDSTDVSLIKEQIRSKLAWLTYQKSHLRGNERG